MKSGWCGGTRSNRGCRPESTCSCLARWARRTARFASSPSTTVRLLSDDPPSQAGLSSSDESVPRTHRLPILSPRPMSYVPPPGSSAAPLPPTFPPLSSSASAMYGTHPMHMPATSSHHRSNSSSSSSHQQWSQSSLGQAVSLAEQEWKKRKANEEADPPSAGGGPGSADQHGYANKDKARGGSTDGAGGVKAVASCKECRRLSEYSQPRTWTRDRRREGGRSSPLSSIHPASLTSSFLWCALNLQRSSATGEFT